MTNFPESETTLPEMFDPATQEGSKFDLLPVGIYKAQITDATVSQPQTGDGWGVNLTWQITEGTYEGRYVWQHITFQTRAFKPPPSAGANSRISARPPGSANK